jgi:hypothetical protein
MATDFHTCRFCGEISGEMIRYGTRHYAHPVCYLDAGKPVCDLPSHELTRLPYFLLKERGLLDHVRAKLAARAA